MTADKTEGPPPHGGEPSMSLRSGQVYLVRLAGALLAADFFVALAVVVRRAGDFFAADRVVDALRAAVFFAPVAFLAVFLAGDFLAVFRAGLFFVVFFAGLLLAAFLVAFFAALLAGAFLVVFLAAFLAVFLAPVRAVVVFRAGAFLAVVFFAGLFLAVFLVAFFAALLAVEAFLVAVFFAPVLLAVAGRFAVAVFAGTLASLVGFVRHNAGVALVVRMTLSCVLICDLCNFGASRKPFLRREFALRSRAHPRVHPHQEQRMSPDP
ncbi:MAG: hypothetical protein ACRDOJ_14340 [Nocardioidaceae bacterium]